MINQTIKKIGVSDLLVTAYFYIFFMNTTECPRGWEEIVKKMHLIQLCINIRLGPQYSLVLTFLGTKRVYFDYIYIYSYIVILYMWTQ
jgi:hypothetical protein